MPNFKRARSEEQKRERAEEIKAAVDKLFQEHPYHTITWTVIADKLGLTRANLYQYFQTKEEIFLELCADKREIYYDALRTAIPKESGYSAEVMAEVWAGILNANTDHLHYSDILHTIIETNVSVDRLAVYKRGFYQSTYAISSWLGEQQGLSRQDSYDMFISIHYHAVGIHGILRWNPIIVAALEKESITPPKLDFRENLKSFIMMNLEHYAKKQQK